MSRLRATSAFVLVCFSSSLAAPLVRADTAGDTSVTASATQTAKVALSDLWFSWVKQGGSASVKPDRTFAFNFFTQQGATADQANILTNNAQAAGQLSTPLPASSGLMGWVKSKLGMNSSPAIPKSLAAQPDSTPTDASGGILGKIKSMFGFGSSSAASDSAASDAQAQDVAAADGSSGGGLGDSIHSGLNKISAAFSNLGVKAKGVANDVGSGISTAVLTAGDKMDLRQYYSIPISDTSAVKITGGSNYTVKFTDNGWVQSSSKQSVNLVDAIKSNEASGQIDQLNTDVGPAEATSGPLASLISKFKDGLSSLKSKITGQSAVSDDDNAQLSTYNVQGNLLEQAQGLTQAQSAIQARIQSLQDTATSLNRPVPTDQINNLQRTLDTIDAQKKDVISKIQDAGQSPASSVVNSGVKWALYSVGIQAGVNIISQVVNGQQVDFKSALSFLGQPSFWAGTAGSFLGSLVLSNVASALIPGGGIFMKIIPGFLGASLGYQAGSSLFGGGQTDWISTIGQALASAGAYALAYSFLGGAGAPAIALIAAGIAGGALFNFIYSKMKGTNANAAGSTAVPTPDINAALPNPQASGAPGAGTAASAVGAGNIDALNTTMQQAYTEYINDLKDQKVTDARAAFDRYSAAKTQLDQLRGAASATATAGQ